MADFGATSSEPEAAWRAVLARDPFDVAALHGLARVLRRRKRTAQAIAVLSAAAAESDDPAILADLGEALAAVGLGQEAEPYFRRVLEAEPGNFAALFGLGRRLLTQGQSAVALDLLRRALAVAPDGADTTATLTSALIAQGNAAYASGDMAQAEQLYREAIDFGLDLVAAYSNLGNALTAQLRVPEALDAYHAALAIDPKADNAGFAYSLCLLLAGDEAEGRRRFEHRRMVEPLRRDHERRPDLPQWRPGVDLAGRRVLLTAEQGSGDLIQYARFAPVLARVAAAVVLEMPWPLGGLFRDMPGIERVIGLDDSDHGCDIACPLLSLPLLLGSDAGVSPPYVSPPMDRSARWQAWLDRSPPGRRIGLVCHGDQRHPRDRDRSIALAAFAPLLTLPDIAFVLVQTEIQSADRSVFEAADNLRCPAAALTDYADTAALLSGLDLLISVDTSVAHLAGAMGLPVWTLLPYFPDHRWGLGSEGSAWYPSMRLFRQERAGAWEPVVERVRGTLGIG
ncbi:tetratricopeptide repeat protein [Acidisphaera sp. S103]|uniref:tetratricopeptide repeat protein n=1 Tax=Acidisphaera sp. S103 TaxID=1747223 RepID=UPI00131BCDAB|nr:tetratricopeptide repeat protein [Acidisphaera sp. S103]